MSSRPQRRFVSQRGASLVEVLVALLIASLGLLSMSGLLAHTSRWAQAAERRNVATWLAADLAERLQGNRRAAQAGHYDAAPGAGPPVPPAHDCTDGTDCSAPQMAEAELAEWRGELSRALPGGMGAMRYDAASGASDIWVAWVEPGDETDGPATACPAAWRGGRLHCLSLRAAL